MSRALHICSENYLAEETEFLIKVFEQNEHSIIVLGKVTKKYMNNITSKKEKVNIETIKNDKILKLPWVPKRGPKLRKEYKKFGRKTIFNLERNLQNLVCRNKSKLLPNSFPGLYQSRCTCSALYLGETKKKVITRTIE